MAIEPIPIDSLAHERLGASVFGGAATPIQIVGRTTSGKRGVRIITLLQASLIGLLIGNLGRIPLFSTGQRNAPLLVSDLCVALMLGVGVLASVRKRSLVIDSVATWALVFAAIGAFSTALAVPRFGLTPFEAMVSLGYLVRWLFYFAIYVVLINTLGDDDVSPAWSAIEKIILAFAAFGVMQSLTMPNFAQLVYPNSRLVADWDPQGHRLASTWLDPNFAGAFIEIGLLLELSLISTGVRVSRWKPVLLMVAIVMTASRGAVVALVAGIPVILIARGLSKRLLRMTIALVALLLIAAPAVLAFTGLFTKLGIDGSAAQKLLRWLLAIRVFTDHYIIGVGFNTWGFVQERYGYDRTFAGTYSLEGGILFIGVMTGVIGITAYLAMIGRVMQRARRVWRDATMSPEFRGLAVGVVAATVTLLVNAIFLNSLMYPFLMEVMWVLWALVSVASKRRLGRAPAVLRPQVTALPG